MRQINITELRQHLPSYLSSVQKGNEICITSHGRIIAHIVPHSNAQKIASKKLEDLRKQNCFVGDVVSPVDEKWDAEQ